VAMKPRHKQCTCYISTLSDANKAIKRQTRSELSASRTAACS